MDELGFGFGIWNGATDSIGLGGSLGAYPSTDLIGNSVSLTLPPPELASHLYEPAVAHHLMLAFVQEWNPAWATWSSFDWVSNLHIIGDRPIAGWKTFVTSTRWRYTRDVDIERTVSGGDLITMRGSFADVTMDELQRLQRLLR